MQEDHGSERHTQVAGQGVKVVLPRLGGGAPVLDAICQGNRLSARAATLPIQTRQDDDYAAFAETHIGVLSIDDRVTHMYFHFVGAGRDVQNLRMIVGRR